MSKPVLVITGAHGALGTAVAKRATADGWDLALIDHAQGMAEEGVLNLCGVDLTDPAQAGRALMSTHEHYGHIDAVMNIAGGFVWQTTDDARPAWDRMHQLNLVTALNTCRAALPYLKEAPEGRIVNVGANAALKSAAGMGAYAASKAGVHRLTESLAEELKDTAVTVNAVLPSILDTAQNRADMPGVDPTKWVAPDDLAAVMLFLASPAARAVTGALIPVMGKV